jgi:predicted RecA/RadA family phage recombinase
MIVGGILRNSVIEISQKAMVFLAAIERGSSGLCVREGVFSLN